MQDWKLNSLPIVGLRGWGYHEPQHRREVSKALGPWRSVVLWGVATIARLRATSSQPSSHEAFPQRDRGDLDPG
jgi:hypothetical protein